MDIDHIGQLHPDPRNARKHNPRNIGMVVNSLQEVGAARSIVIDEEGNVLAGNGTIEAAAQAGIERVQVVDADGETIVAVRRSGLSEEQKKRLALFDNRTAELAGWDVEVLQELSEQGDALEGLFSGDELDTLLASLDTRTEGDGGDEFDTTPQDGPTRVQRGELWRIGDHRLLCGDATSAEDVGRLMGGDRTAICFTSPPYNVGVSAQLSGNTHLNDSLYVGDADDKGEGEYVSFLSAFTQEALQVSQYVFVNVQPLAGNKRALVTYMAAFKDRLADVATWCKDTAAPLLAQRVMNSQFEWLLIFSPEQNPSRAIGTKQFRGTVSNVYHAPPQRNNEYAEVHGATFPLHLPTWVLEMFTNKGEQIYEPFAGTGTTLIAAHRTGRKCYGLEIEPKYCDVILRRAEAEGIGPIELVGGNA